MLSANDIPHYPEICDALKSYGVTYAGLFGSRAYGDNKPDSDYDLLVDFAPNSGTTLLGVISLKQKLEDILNNKVDIVTRGSISPYLKDSVLKNVIPIYGQKS